jgi:RNA recognition motif-containing protein
MKQASSDKKQIDVGANLFIGNLDPAVDERLLYDTFSVFGALTQPAKVRNASVLVYFPWLTHRLDSKRSGYTTV